MVVFILSFYLAELWDDLPCAVATVTANPEKAVPFAHRGALNVGWRETTSVRVRRVD